MISYFSRVVVLALLLGGQSSSASAQQTANADALPVMVAAYQHLQADRGASPVVVDFRMSGFDAPHELERPFARLIRAAIASDIPREQQRIVCKFPGAEKPYCTFNEFASILLTSRPEIAGDLATVKIYRFLATGADTIVSEEFHYELRRTRGEWRVTNAVLRQVT